MKADGVTPEQKVFILSVLKKHFPDAKIYFFGSRTRGDFKKYSDLDLCIDNTEPLDLVVLSEVKEVFSQSNLPYQVDISDWQRITPDFRDLILANSVIW